MSRLAEMQARFQQKQMQEKEEKLLKLYENQQQRAFERVGRGSAGSNISGGSSPVGVGKVRQLFDERRQKAGIDRSYPLEPLKQLKTNGHVPTNRVSSLDRTNTMPKNSIRTASTFKTTVQRSITQVRPGKPLTTRTMRQSTDATYANGELLEENSTYEERNDNDDPLLLLRNQQKELEIMMDNHCIDDEEFSDVGIDDVDEGEEPIFATENGNSLREIKEISNGNHRRITEVVSTENTPIKKLPAARPQPIAQPIASKNSIGKTKTSPTKAQIVSSMKRPTNSASQKSPSDEKKSPMKSVSSPPPRPGPVAPRSQTSRPGARVQPNVSQRAQPNVAQRGPSNVSSRGQAVSAVNRDDLKPCKHCGRRFAGDRLGLHEDICARTLKKKRKLYDPVKHRVTGTDAEGYVKKGGRVTSVKPKAQPPKIGKPDWRRQHEEFISAIRAAKQAQAHVARGGKLSDLPPPPPSLNPDYIQCPHCGRRFNEAAATRHIPKCATMIHNKPKRTGVQNQNKRF